MTTPTTAKTWDFHFTTWNHMRLYLLSHHKQLQHWTKYMKQQVSSHWRCSKKGYLSLRIANKWGATYYCPRLRPREPLQVRALRGKPGQSPGVFPIWIYGDGSLGKPRWPGLRAERRELHKESLGPAGHPLQSSWGLISAHMWGNSPKLEKNPPERTGENNA